MLFCHRINVKLKLIKSNSHALENKLKNIIYNSDNNRWRYAHAELICNNFSKGPICFHYHKICLMIHSKLKKKEK